MEIKTSELTSRALDWAVARAIGFEDIVIDCDFILVVHERHELPGLIKDEVWSPSTDWSQCGPLIEKHSVQIIKNTDEWVSCCPGELYYGAETPLVAACRAIVVSNSGETVTVPDELEG